MKYSNEFNQNEQNKDEEDNFKNNKSISDSLRNQLLTPDRHTEM